MVITRKIVCTIGPSSDSDPVLEEMVAGGMDIARLNLSHGTHATHRKRFKNLRNMSRDVGIMFDIQGPKIRLGTFEDSSGSILSRGDIFVLTAKDVPGSSHISSVDYPRLAEIVYPRDTIFINDGLVELTVERIIDGTDVVCRVKTGGEVGTGKGVNIPGKSSATGVPTKKDVEDLRFIAQLKPDFLSVSFVSSAGDVAKVREIIRKEGADIPLIAKIERKEALKNISSIIRESDGIMIARGDLAVEVSSEKVPPIQKDFIKRARESGKPVICATQMLESMRFHSRPTRAESSDVFNAILDGADALMLSGETAIGAYPLESLKMMRKLIKEAEGYVHHGKKRSSRNRSPGKSNDVLAGALAKISLPGERQRKKVKVILHPVSREALIFISTFLPGFTVLAPTADLSLYRMMKVYGGVLPLLLEKGILGRYSNPALVSELKKRGALRRGDSVITVKTGGKGEDIHVSALEYL